MVSASDLPMGMDNLRSAFDQVDDWAHAMRFEDTGEDGSRHDAAVREIFSLPAPEYVKSLLWAAARRAANPRGNDGVVVTDAPFDEPAE